MAHELGAPFQRTNSIVRAEETAHPFFFSDEYFEELTWDALLLSLCLIAWLVTSYTTSRRKNLAVLPSSVQKEYRTAPAVHEPAPSAAESFVASLLRADDRQIRANALETYIQLRTRIDWSAVPTEDSQRAFSHLCCTATRNGKTKVLFGLLSDMTRLGVPRTHELYTGLLKVASSKRLFREVLLLWERICADGVELDDRCAWSCLLFAATEEKVYDMAAIFFKKLQAREGITEKDYGNMIRLLASRSEGRAAYDLLQQMRAQGMEPDNFTYNAVLASCAIPHGGKMVDLAEGLFNQMKALDSCVDAITYNTFIKGLVQNNRFEEAFAQLAEMEVRGFAPTQVTFGTLLDACVNAGRMDRAQVLLKKMTQSGCEMNTILYTTIIKGFVKQHDVEKVLQMYDDMCSQGLKPDTITFSLILKALCDAGKLEQALVMFETICSDGYRPDEIIFNNLISGCAVRKNVDLGKKLLKDMVQFGIKPSCATFSTFVKLFTECEELAQGQAFLEGMEANFEYTPEPRLYMQLVHACLRKRDRQRVLEVSRAMVARHGVPDAVESAKILRACNSFNMHDVGVQFAGLVLQNGGHVETNELQAMVDWSAKKRKYAVVDAVMELAQKYRLHVKAA